MALQIANSAKPTLAALVRPFLNGLTLRLYINSYSPNPAMKRADFQEATFPGYAPAPLNDFPAPALIGNVAKMTAPPKQFTCTGAPAPAQTVYGYFVVDAQDALVYAEERTGGGVPITGAGQTFTVVPVFDTDTL